jgi:hypothetical protein
LPFRQRQGEKKFSSLESEIPAAGEFSQFKDNRTFFVENLFNFGRHGDRLFYSDKRLDKLTVNSSIGTLTREF